MTGLEEPYYDSAEWFYDSAPFIEVCQKNMNDLYEPYMGFFLPFEGRYEIRIGFLDIS